jgi:hypothetical protein
MKVSHDTNDHSDATPFLNFCNDCLTASDSGQRAGSGKRPDADIQQHEV